MLSGTEQPRPENNSEEMEGAVLFAGIASQPIDVLPPELGRALSLLIQQAGADGLLRVVAFKSAVRINATAERSFHSREAELDQMLRVLDCDV